MFSLRREELIVIGLLLVTSLLIGIKVLPNPSQNVGWEFKTEEIKTSSSSEKSGEEKKIVVHIAGAVNRPGVYALAAASRLFEALALAGGESLTADLDQINLAAPLRDGMQIYIPEKFSQEQKGDSQRVTNTSGTICINSASQLELESLPGIGPAKATAIIRYRQEEGPFQDPEDLLNVNGIGQKTFLQLKDLIRVY